jgi:hypothetical protein
MEVGAQNHDLATLSHGKEPRYQMNRMLGRPHSRSGSFSRRQKSLGLAEIRTLDRPDRRLVTISTTLTRRWKYTKTHSADRQTGHISETVTIRDLMRCALVWGITQRRVVIIYSRFRTTYRSHLQGSRNSRRVAFLDFLTLEDGTDTLSRNVSKGITTWRCVTPQKSADLISIAAEAWNHGSELCFLAREGCFELHLSTSFNSHICRNFTHLNEPKVTARHVSPVTSFWNIIMQYSGRASDPSVCLLDCGKLKR